MKRAREAERVAQSPIIASQVRPRVFKYPLCLRLTQLRTRFISYTYQIYMFADAAEMVVWLFPYEATESRPWLGGTLLPKSSV